MPDPSKSPQTFSPGQEYRTLLAVSDAIISHRDLRELFHDLAGRLHAMVRFDYLALLLRDDVQDALRLHVLEPSQPSADQPVVLFPIGQHPGGQVWQNQQPVIVPDLETETRWPQFLERARSQISSCCLVPLTTARHRLGVLGFGCKQSAAYDTADVDFLQQIASQVAVAVENALAFDQIEQLKEQLEKEKLYLEEEVRTDHNFEEIVGESAALKRILKEVDTVAPTDSTVLILGETGTGKELIARAIHQLSPRRNGPLVILNCAAIPAALLESELFGHERGAFTGAVTQRIGRFEQASGGTLFLDEIGELALDLQVKLLRVLQEQEFERLGSTRTTRVNVRVVAATNRDLTEMVAEGQFRNDLYYRLNVFPVVLPPLRDRREDIPPLVRHFTQQFARRMGRRIETIPTEAMDALVWYPWPGNIRELENVIERAVILSPGPTLRIPVVQLKSPGPTERPTRTVTTLIEAEREHILGALRESNWVLGGPNGAAARLGTKRTTLQWKMKKLGISRPD
jgi:formate hydrogenlyase transcriptional activator